MILILKINISYIVFIKVTTHKIIFKQSITVFENKFCIERPLAGIIQIEADSKECLEEKDQNPKIPVEHCRNRLERPRNIVYYVSRF